MADYFRVTVEDLKTGDKQTVEVAAGDFMIIPFAPCYLDSTVCYSTGTTVLTLKDHKAQGKPRPPEDSSGPVKS